MSVQPSLTALGELLIDFTPAGLSPAGSPCFEQNPGGAPANVLASFAKLGGLSSFIGMVGNDSFGLWLEKILEEKNICAAGLKKTDRAGTSLAFVHLDASGDRSFSFYRNPGADRCLSVTDIDTQIIEKSEIFHFGSISLTDEPARSATLYAAAQARKLGKLVSFDPNWRPLLWRSRETGVKRIKEALSLADIVKVSEEEAFLITGEADIEKAAAAMTCGSIKLVVATLGAKGCYFYTGSESGYVPAYTVQVIDTTGCGDSFWGAFLYRLAVSQSNLTELSCSSLKDICAFANAAGSLCASCRGAIPAMPSLEQIRTCMDTVPLLIFTA